MSEVIGRHYSAMQGNLKKKGGLGRREWQMRYFCSSKDDPQKLEYFLTDKHVNPQGSLSLVGATVADIEVKGKSILQITVSGGRNYHLSADTAEEHTQWLEGLKKLAEGSENVAVDLKREDIVPQDAMQETILSIFETMDKKFLFERFIDAPAGEGTAASRSIDKKVVVQLASSDFSKITIDEKWIDPLLLKAIKLRPSFRITNPECLDTLSKRFQGENEACTSSKCTNQFQALAPTLDNLLYDKSLCDKNDFVRKINEVLTGLFIVPVMIELDEDSIFQKIQGGDGVPSSATDESKEEEPTDVDAEPISSISLEKTDNDDEMEEIPLGDAPLSTISLDKAPESSISLDKAPESSISLDKAPESSISLEKGPESSISLDKAPESSISLEKAPESSISLDKGPESSISLEKAPESSISLQKI